ncbi:MAG: helix-turn-helix transcriptional regulator [Clostridia bacterium]|nr:helix-turn-helix transcriptional regulator [Clostridia bacterium]
MTIGEKIRHYRLKNELTQEKLAAEVAVSYQAVSKWERNESLPDVTVIARLADALHVTCDTLLTDNGCFTEREIDGILRDAAQLSSQDHDEYRRRVRLLETALEKHPRSFRLMAALAETYSMGAAYPEFTELDYLGRTVDLEETIAAHCTDPKLRNQTT